MWEKGDIIQQKDGWKINSLLYHAIFFILHDTVS